MRRQGSVGVQEWREGGELMCRVETWCVLKDGVACVLGIFVVGEPVKQVHDDLKHRLKKAYFVTRYTTKDAKSLRLYLPLPLLLELDSILP